PVVRAEAKGHSKVDPSFAPKPTTPPALTTPGFGGGGPGTGFTGGGGGLGGKPTSVEDFARRTLKEGGKAGEARGDEADKDFKKLPKDRKPDQNSALQPLDEAKRKKEL